MCISVAGHQRQKAAISGFYRDFMVFTVHFFFKINVAAGGCVV
jgi:hypothetical protein